MTTHIAHIRIVLAALLLLLVTFSSTAYVSAETRDASDRGSTTSHTLTPPASTPAPAPTPTPAPAPLPPPPPGGGITSSTEGDVDSGGNTGGIVSTGDEHVDVHEVNEGPTNNPPPPVVTPTPTPTPAPICDSRARTGCAGVDGGRAR